MHVLCTYCDRLTPLNEFRLEGEVLIIRCERCNLEPCAERRDEAWHRRLAELGPLPEPPARVDPGFCPKCFERRTLDETSCRACGVTYGSFRPDTMRLTGRLASLWEASRSHPGDVEARTRLMEAAQDTGMLPLLGRLYRQALLENPRDIPALTGLAEVRSLSTQDLSLAAQPAEEKPSRKLPFVVLVACGVLLGLLSWSLR